MSDSSASFVCPTCGKERPGHDKVMASHLHGLVRERIQLEHPDWDGSTTCRSDVRRYRVAMLRAAVEQQRGEVESLENSVLERMARRELVSKNLGAPPEELGPRVADAVASFGGSWPFLGMFGTILFCWIATNLVLLSKPFDPYPFILLNLVLSCLAAIQAPVIMMSQNRHSVRDRERAEHDYEINLKAELEVQLLHEKLDHLVLVEWQKLLDIQAIQTEMLQELAPPASREE